MSSIMSIFSYIRSYILFYTTFCPSYSFFQTQQLLHAAQLYAGEGLTGGIGWGKVAQHLGGQRTPKQCRDRWIYLLSLSSKNPISAPSSTGKIERASRGDAQEPWTSDEVQHTHLMCILLYAPCQWCMYQNEVSVRVCVLCEYSHRLAPIFPMH
jgi:hypothetical protein